MRFWESVWKLVRFELKHSWKHYGFTLLFAIALVLLIYKSLPSYIKSPNMGLDLYFTLSFIFFSQIFRPKQFQGQKLYSIHYAAPILITLNQLAVEKRAIVVYRFLVYLITNTIFSLIILISVYPVFHHSFSQVEYLAFIVIWLALSIFIGAVNPTFEAYSNVGWNIFFALIFGLVIFIPYIYIFFKWNNFGFIGWTMEIAVHYPWWSMFFSIIFAGLGLIFWMKQMEKRMKKTDYLA